jgi:hypothetical protein
MTPNPDDLLHPSDPAEALFQFEAEPEKKGKTNWTILKAGISASLLIFLITQIKWEAFLTALASISVIYLLYPLLAYYINVALSVFKWQSLLKFFGIQDHFFRLFRVYMIGAYYNNFLPTTIGGDGYRFIKMRSAHNGKSGVIFSSILLERGFGYLVLLLLNLVLAAWFWERIAATTWLVILEIALVAGVILAGLVWIFRHQLAAWLKNWESPRSRFWARMVDRLVRLLGLIDIRNPATLAISFLTSLLFVLIGGVWLAVYYWSVGAPVNWLYALYVSTVINLAGVIPLTLNGLGFVELLQVQLMGLVGIPIETVLVVALMSRVMLILLSLPGGVLSFRSE